MFFATTSFLVKKSVCNFTQNKTVKPPCSEQNLRRNQKWKSMLRVNVILWDFHLRHISHRLLIALGAPQVQKISGDQTGTLIPLVYTSQEHRDMLHWTWRSFSSNAHNISVLPNHPSTHPRWVKSCSKREKNFCYHIGIVCVCPNLLKMGIQMGITKNLGRTLNMIQINIYISPYWFRFDQRRILHMPTQQYYCSIWGHSLFI